MIGRERLFKRLETVLATSKADQMEICYWGQESAATRFANSIIHQNVFENRPNVIFRAVVDGRVGVAETVSVHPADLKRTMLNACEIAAALPPKPFPGLPKPRRYRESNQFDPATARLTPARRARLVKQIIDTAGAGKFSLAGLLTSSSIESAVLSSRGVRAYHPLTFVTVSIIASSESSSGYAAGMARGVNDLDYKALASVARDKCEQGQDPIDIEPGSYEVILEPAAVSEILGYLNMIGFRSRTIEEKTSLLTGRIGKKITSSQVTLYTDAFEKGTITIPFDFEGMPRRSKLFIANGVAKGGIIDRLRDPKSRDGQALVATWSHFGAAGYHIGMKPGNADRATMMAGVKRGLLVTRFHYVRECPGPRSDVLTGMTRDGTFLIENGRITKGVKNLRFTDSFMRSMGTTVAISRQRELVAPEFAAFCILAPTVHLKSLRFGSTTEF